MATASKNSSTAKPKSSGPQTDAPQIKGTKIGVVESDKRQKTRKVVLSYVDKHPKYGKYIQKRTVLHVHDEGNISRNGDIVEIAQCRPLSKTKQWKLVRIVEQRSKLRVDPIAETAV
jgi:small subunit ribosomal protein S17